MRPMLRVGNIAMSLVLLAIAACGFIPKTRSWTEDVQLDDGSVITIERYVRFKTSNSWAGDVPRAEDRRATLRFTGALADLPAWDVPLMPMVLYRDAPTKEWVIVARTNRCEIWIARGSPFPPYWEYHLVAGHWRPRPLSEASKGRPANLLIEYRRENLPRHITVEYKKASFADRGLSEAYRRIVPDIRRHCMVNAE
jgi:hypothetical protein